MADSKKHLGDPVAIAKEFAASMTQQGVQLDFSLMSLETQVDRLLQLPLFQFGRKGVTDQEQGRYEASLGAYIGETLRQLYDGEWRGEFYPGGPENFYTSFVQFGEYRFWPSHFIGYRLANGEKSEGSFYEFLKQALPKIQQRRS